MKISKRLKLLGVMFSISLMCFGSLSYADDLFNQKTFKSSQEQTDAVLSTITDKDLKLIVSECEQNGIVLSEEQKNQIVNKELLKFTDEQATHLTKSLQNILDRYSIKANRIIESTRDKHGTYNSTLFVKNDDGNIVVKFRVSTKKDGTVEYALSGGDADVVTFFKNRYGNFLSGVTGKVTKSDLLTYKEALGVYNSLNSRQQSLLSEEKKSLDNIGVALTKTTDDLESQSVDETKVDESWKKQVSDFKSKYDVTEMEKMGESKDIDKLKRLKKDIDEGLDYYNTLSFAAQEEVRPLIDRLNALNKDVTIKIQKLEDEAEAEKARKLEAEAEKNADKKPFFSMTTFIVIIVILSVATGVGYLVYKKFLS